jgi:hypothetical protein
MHMTGRQWNIRLGKWVHAMKLVEMIMWLRCRGDSAYLEREFYDDG